jgi:hypothetical protein
MLVCIRCGVTKTFEYGAIHEIEFVADLNTGFLKALIKTRLPVGRHLVFLEKSPKHERRCIT